MYLDSNWDHKKTINLFSIHNIFLAYFHFHYCSSNDVNSKLLTVWFYFNYMIYCMTYSVSYQHLILVWVIDMNHAEEYVLGWIKFDYSTDNCNEGSEVITMKHGIQYLIIHDLHIYTFVCKIYHHLDYSILPLCM